MTPETRELRKVVDFLKAEKLLHLRLALMPGVAAGWPDLQVFVPGGLTLLVEMKRPGRKPSDLQARRLSDLNAIGHHANWFSNSDDAIRWIMATIVTFHAASQSKVSEVGSAALHAAGGGLPLHPPVSGPATRPRRSKDLYNSGGVLPPA